MPNNWFGFLKQYEDLKELKNLAKDIIFLSDIKPYDKILDIGTGTGRIAFAAYKKINENGSVTGVDFEQQNIDFCNQKCQDYELSNNITFLNADLTKRLPFDDESFDIIFSRSVLMHIEKKEKVIKELFRILKPNGKILLYEVMIYDKLFRIYKFLDKNCENYSKYREIEEIVRNDTDDPVTDFDFSSLKNIIKSCGFKNIFSSKEKDFEAIYPILSENKNWKRIFYDNSSIPRKYTLKEKFLKYMTEDEYTDYEKTVKEKMSDRFVLIQAECSYIYATKRFSFFLNLKILSRFLFISLKNFQFIKNCEVLQQISLRIEMAVNYLKLLIKEKELNTDTITTILRILFV